MRAMHDANLTAATTKVLRVEIPDVPGGLVRSGVGGGAIAATYFGDPAEAWFVQDARKVDRLLVSVGRRPYTEGLLADDAGVTEQAGHAARVEACHLLEVEIAKGRLVRLTDCGHRAKQYCRRDEQNGEKRRPAARAGNART